MTKVLRTTAPTMGRFLALILCAVFALGVGGRAWAIDANQAVGLAQAYRADLWGTLGRVQRRLRAHPVLPSVMANPPTFTQQANFAVSTISGYVFIGAQDARLGLWDAANLAQGPSGALNDGVTRQFYNCGLAIAGSPCVLNLSFQTDAAQIDLVLEGTTSLTVLVDGQLASSGVVTATVSGSSRFIESISFGASQPQTHDIQIFAQVGYGFAGLYIGPNDSIGAGSAGVTAGRDAITMTVQGDSYTQRMGLRGILPVELALQLGASSMFIDGVGGTGYAQNNGTASFPTANNYLYRATPGQPAQQTFSRWNSDLDVILGGINDLSTITSSSVLSVLQAHRALFPNAIIVVAGNWQPDQLYTRVSPSNKQVSVQTAINAAVPQLQGPWVLIDNINGTWSNSAGKSGSLGGTPFQTGSGYVGHTTGSGNGDLYIDTDGTHPTTNGVAYLMGREANGIRDGVLSLCSSGNCPAP